MLLSQKCQYSVRAILELAKHYGSGIMRCGEIAERQAIPQRFLEVILNELKSAGLVDARRGIHGGFSLAVPPKDLTVGRVIRLVDGPLDPVRCVGKGGEPCTLRSGCSLVELWNQAKSAVEAIYDGTTFQDLVEREQLASRASCGDYTI